MLHSWSTLLLLCSQRAGEFGPGTKDFWLDDVKCTGDERSIALCSHREWGRHNCLDFNQAGVVCKLRLKDKITTPEPAKPGDEVIGLSCHVTIWSRCYVKHECERMHTIEVEVKKTTNDYISLLYDFRLTRFLLPSSIVSCFQGTESQYLLYYQM